MQAFLQNCLRDYDDDLEWQEEQSYAARAAWRVTTTMALGKGVTIWWSNKLQLFLHQGSALINSQNSHKDMSSLMCRRRSIKILLRRSIKILLPWSIKILLRWSIRILLRRSIKILLRRSIRILLWQSIRILLWWSIKILLWWSILRGREARPPYGVSGKGDHSNTRESIRSENMDRLRALVPSH
jgi:hypothetical protein